MPTNTTVKYKPTMGSVQSVIAVMDWLFTNPDSDSILRRAGISRYQLRSLEADDEVSQCKDTHKDAVLTTPWRIEPNQTRAAKKITSILTPHANDLLSIAVDAVSYGYSVAQINWEKSAGVTRIKAAWQCPIEWFKPTYTGDLLAAQTLYFEGGKVAAWEGESVLTKYPGVYFHVVRNSSYTQPYGEALLSRLYYPVTWRRQGWGLWLGYLETFAQPILIGQTPDYNAFVTALQAQGIRSVVGFQTGGEETKITTVAGTQAGEFERLEQALIDRIQRLYLGQTFSSGIRSGGSYAAGQALEVVRKDKRNSAIRLLTPFMQRVVDTIADLNGFTRHEFVMADDTGIETLRAERDAKLLPVLTSSGLMFTPDYFTDRYDYADTDLTPIAGIPSKPDEKVEDETAEEDEGDDMEDTGQEQGEEQQSESLIARETFATKLSDPGEFQSAIDSYVKKATGMIGQAFSEKSLRKIIREATDRQDLERRLGALVKVGSPEYTDLLEKAGFASQVLGYVAAEEKSL